jgi:hypothetical protein
MAAELATIRSFGWRDRALARLVITAVAAALPAVRLRRLPTAHLLAEEGHRPARWRASCWRPSAWADANDPCPPACLAVSSSASPSPAP